MEAIKKAWRVGITGWDTYDPEMQDIETIYAHTRNEARAKWFSRDLEGNRYIDVKAKRFPNGDRFVFEGRECSREWMEYKIRWNAWVQEMEDLVKANKGKKVYIWSGQWGAYWRPNCCGYTNRVSDAGVYDIQEAWNSISHCGLEKKISLELITT